MLLQEITVPVNDSILNEIDGENVSSIRFYHYTANENFIVAILGLKRFEKTLPFLCMWDVKTLDLVSILKLFALHIATQFDCSFLPKNLEAASHRIQRIKNYVIRSHS